MITDLSLQPTLLTAKFHRPAAPRRAVPRPALTVRLNDGLAAGRPLTLIAAPAGYGKTPLAAAWAGQLDRPVAWLALDEADDDPLRFFAYFVAALQQVAPAVGAALTPALRAGQLPSPDVLVTTLLNDLAAAAPMVCVLDDFHVLQDRAIMGVLGDLLAHPSAGLHLVLVTREDPPLPLARLRARDQLTEVRAADLRFDEAEIAALLRDGMGLPLSAPDVARLAERTEGWAAGLQLVGLSLQGRPDASAFIQSLSGTHRFILDYLTEEVLARQPAEVQAFLLRTSILAQLTAELCDAVTSPPSPGLRPPPPPFPEPHYAQERGEGVGGSGARSILDYLERANIFLIPLDDEGRWYRYHHLFAELLQAQLRRMRPEEVAGLHARASRWYEAHDMPAEAIGHALAAAEHDRVVALLERHGWALLNRGYARTLEGWLSALPAGLRDRSPRLSLDFGWMHLLRGNLPQVAPHLAQAEAAAHVPGTPAPPAEPGQASEIPDTSTAAWRSECLALRANLLQAQGRAAEAIEAGRQALALAPADDHRLIGLASLALGGAYRQLPDFDRAMAALQDAIAAGRASGNLVTEMLAVSHLTLMATQYGRLRLAAQVAAEALDRLAHVTASPSAAPVAASPTIIGAVHGALGLIYYEWNQLDRAREHLQTAIRLSALAGHNASLIYSQVNLARLLQAEGRLDDAANALAEASRLLAAGAPGWLRPPLIGEQARLALARGDDAAAEAHLRASGVGPDDPVTAATDPIHLAWLRLLTGRGDARAAGLAERIIRSAEAGGRHGTLLRALLAAAHLAGDDLRAARRYLDRALALAEPEGAVRPFLDEGPALQALLARLDRPAISSSPPRRGGQGGEVSPSPLRRGGQGGEVIEPLSERELEVLRLLAEGLTYAEIADRLVVSLNTVRFHVKEIYGKLGVNRQAHAVARARELGLL